MSYLDTTTFEYPIEEGSIRTRYPNTSFPSPFSPPEPFAAVKPTAQPAFDPITQRVALGMPVNVGGVWTETWQVIALDPATVAENRERAQKQLVADIVNSTQARLDTFARTRYYDGILSACTYASSTNAKFQAEGQYCVEARDATWAKLYEVMAKVEAGTRPMPSGYADVEPLLPVLTWPN